MTNFPETVSTKYGTAIVREIKGGGFTAVLEDDGSNAYKSLECCTGYGSTVYETILDLVWDIHSWKN